MVQKLSHPPRWDNNFEPRSQFMSGFSEELFITLLCCCCLVLRLKTSGSLEAFEEVEVRDLVQLMTCLRSWLANTRSLQRFKLWPHFMDWIRFHIGTDGLFQTLWPLASNCWCENYLVGELNLVGNCWCGNYLVGEILCICLCVFVFVCICVSNFVTNAIAIAIADVGTICWASRVWRRRRSASPDCKLSNCCHFTSLN